MGGRMVARRCLGAPIALARLARVLLRVAVSGRTAPQCVLVLGGCKRRELAAARMYSTLPSARMLLLSSGEAELEEMQAAAAPAAAHSVIVDRSAVDTVTNFTTVARALAAAGVTSVACATAREHLPRALAVGTLALGAEGLEATALPVDSAEALREGWARTLRDVARTLLWLVSGVHGASLNQCVHPERVADAQARGAWTHSRSEAKAQEKRNVERFREALAREDVVSEEFGGSWVPQPHPHTPNTASSMEQRHTITKGKEHRHTISSKQGIGKEAPHTIRALPIRESRIGYAPLPLLEPFGPSAWGLELLLRLHLIHLPRHLLHLIRHKVGAHFGHHVGGLHHCRHLPHR